MDEFESFIGKVGGYEEALQQEYEVASSDPQVETIRKLIEQKIAKALPSFVDDLILIARTGDTDSSRLKAIQFAFNWYFKESSSADDPFSKLLSDLTAPSKPTKPDLNPQLRATPPISPYDPADDPSNNTTPTTNTEPPHDEVDEFIDKLMQIEEDD